MFGLSEREKEEKYKEEERLAKLRKQSAIYSQRVPKGEERVVDSRSRKNNFDASMTLSHATDNAPLDPTYAGWLLGQEPPDSTKIDTTSAVNTSSSTCDTGTYSSSDSGCCANDSGPSSSIDSGSCSSDSGNSF